MMDRVVESLAINVYRMIIFGTLAVALGSCVAGWGALGMLASGTALEQAWEFRRGPQSWRPW